MIRALAGKDDVERLCVATRQRRHPNEMLRFVAGPDGSLVPDVAEKLPGRGVWVTCHHSLVETARVRGAFARHLKAVVRVDEKVAGQVGELLKRRALESLSLVMKAGDVVTGFDSVANAIASNWAFCLIHASDAADDGRSKLDRKLDARVWSNDKPALKPVVCFDRKELGLALGRANVVHACLKMSGVSRKFLRDTERLTRYTADDDAPGVPYTRDESGKDRSKTDTE